MLKRNTCKGLVCAVMVAALTVSNMPFGSVSASASDKVGKVTIKLAKRLGKRVKVKWKSVRGASKYRMVLAKKKSGKQVVYKKTTKSTKVTTTALATGTYYVRVRAIGKKKGAWSKAKKVKVKAVGYTVSKKAGTYQGQVDVTIQVKKKYKVYYNLNQKTLTTAKLISAGTSKTITVDADTTLYIYSTKKSAKITQKKLKKKTVKRATDVYTYKIIDAGQAETTTAVENTTVAEAQTTAAGVTETAAVSTDAATTNGWEQTTADATTNWWQQPTNADATTNWWQQPTNANATTNWWQQTTAPVQTDVATTMESPVLTTSETTLPIDIPSTVVAGETTTAAQLSETSAETLAAPVGLAYYGASDTLYSFVWQAVDGAESYNIYLNGNLLGRVVGTGTSLYKSYFPAGMNIVGVQAVKGNIVSEITTLAYDATVSETTAAVTTGADVTTAPVVTETASTEHVTTQQLTETAAMETTSAPVKETTKNEGDITNTEETTIAAAVETTTTPMITETEQSTDALPEVPTNIGNRDIEQITGSWQLAENGYVYSGAGYHGGASVSDVPVAGAIDLTTRGVIANDGVDDTAALQAAIDSLKGIASAQNHYVLQLPAGEINISDEIHMDVSGVILRGTGNNVENGGTKIVFKPWKVYDVVDGEPQIDGKLWPGYAAFRVQTREKSSKEQNYEGSVNFHWISGVKTRTPGNGILNETAGGTQGDNKVYLSNVNTFAVGDSVLVLGCNTEKFLTETYAKTPWRNEHVRNQMFTVTAVNKSEKSLTLDKPLEFDLPYSNEGKIANTEWYSKVVKLQTVTDVGFEKFCLETTLEGTEYEGKVNAGMYNAVTNPNGVAYRYQNAAPEYAVSSFMFKWSEDCWMDGVRINMSASHPIVTEFARHLTIQNNFIDGAWNKGKGGHGYCRLSKVYDSIIRNNDIRRVRHLALQWSATGNLVLNNYLTCDINLHGGWARNNWIEGNKSELPYEHRSWNLEGPENETWYNIWWGSGAHAGDWAAASGYNNVLYQNEFYKQETEGGNYQYYSRYSGENIIHIGWDGKQWKHLSVNGAPIATWGPYVWTDFSTAPNAGVYIENKQQEQTEPPVNTDEVLYCSTAGELKTALANAQAGQTIKLKPGVYEMTEADTVGVRSAYFYGTADGTENSKIVLESEDPENPAILKGGSIETAGYALYITGDYWEIKNIKVTYGQKGIILDNSNYTRIYGCEVYEVGQEGIHIRDGSSYCVIENTHIHDTGATGTDKDMGFGEGLYIGSDRSVWDVNEGTSGSKAEIGYGYDRKVWNTHVLNCTIGSNVTAECIDIKEGTSGTIIEDCTFLGGGASSMLFADSFIDVKGINVTIRNNVGYKENNPNLTKTIAEIRRTSTEPWCPAEETSDGNVNKTTDGNVYSNNIFYDGMME